MAKFLAMYLIPAAVIAEWSKTDPDIKKAAEDKMRGEWTAWMGKHGHAIGDTGAGGRTRRVDSDGTHDTKNGIMVYSFVEAASHAEATAMFENHPHLQIPQASIEVMEVRPMSGM